jgi:DNA-nicking Smr family endonuclease
VGRRPRQVSAEEAKLWRAVLRDVKPLVKSPSPMASAPPEPPLPAPLPASTPDAAKPPLPASVISPPTGRPNGIDGHTMKQLSKGARPVEATIDLHGMTLDMAHAVLNRFIRAQSIAGRRCLLVITGKGDSDRPGRLRREVPLWLAQWSPPVLAVTPAAARHGGGGAFYVLLQRRR